MSKAKQIDPLDRKFKLETLTGTGVRGKYFSRVKQGSNLVKLEPEIARMFPTEASVNAALASVIQLAKLPNLNQAPPTLSRKRAAA
jgi:hypothetical protein